MKKVFKASILAASVAFAFAANAATVTSTPVKLSSEGVIVGNKFTGTTTFDVVVTKEHASTSEIVLTFSDKVSLANVTAAAGGVVTNTVGAGTGVSGDISFNYGTGSFTFDNVVVNATNRTIKFKVNLGNPLTANSSFRISIADTDVTGAATVSYASNLAGAEIETGTGTIATENAQFAVSVSKKLDGVIERKDRVTFARNGESAITDTLELKFVDNAATVQADAFAKNTVVTLTGDFSDAVTHPVGAWTAAGGTVARVNATTFTITYTEAQFNTAAGLGKDTITFTKAGLSTIESSDFTANIKHDFSAAAAGAGTANSKSFTDLDAGEWELDAAVINVPYLPINYGLSANIEVANHGDTEAEIVAEGFDQNGKTYGPVVVKTIDGQTMGKISESDLKDVFEIGADEKVKLNVTFVIDQDADKVTLVPYYKEGESRINVMSDQYKADNIR